MGYEYGIYLYIHVIINELYRYIYIYIYMLVLLIKLETETRKLTCFFKIYPQGKVEWLETRYCSVIAARTSNASDIFPRLFVVVFDLSALFI